MTKTHMKNTENTAKTAIASTSAPTIEAADATEKAATKPTTKPAAEKTVKPAAKPAAKPVTKKIVKSAAKKTVKPAAKKIVKPAAKKTVKPVVRASSVFTLTAKAAHVDFGSGQRFAIAKLLKNGATRAQLIAKLPDISPANISWYLSMMVGTKLVKKTAQ